MNAAIEFRNLGFALPQGRVLLHDISFSVEEGTTTAILGRSGSGKSTLLRTVNRLIEPTSGEVCVHGRPADASELIALRRSIGYVIQETGLFPHFTVERNVGLVLEAEGRPRAERTQRSRDLLTAVGLDPEQFARRYPHQLSGGQRQRVGLARALAAEPAILLMDEPFGALDPLTRAEMQEMLRDLLAHLARGESQLPESMRGPAETVPETTDRNQAIEADRKPVVAVNSQLSTERRAKTVLLVTHDLDEALFLASRIVLVEAGRVVADLPPHEFLHTDQPAVAAYVKAFHRGERARA